MYAPLSDLLTEADVETKIIWPLLTDKHPRGLGYASSDIRLKSRIATLFPIGKGKTKSNYIPDFIVMVHGLPMIAVEAKAPNESVDEGFREARMYANELSAIYPEGVNPCQWIIASNGKQTLFGRADSDTPFATISHANLAPVDFDFASALNRMARRTLEPIAAKLRHSADDKPSARPLDMIAGTSEIQRQLARNPLGVILTGNYSHLFDPKTPEDRSRIVKDAYVPSKERQDYASEIDELIRGAVRDRKHESETADSSSIIQTLRMGRTQLIGEFMFLIGRKGSGKSTFVDYLRDVQLPSELLDSSLWVRLDALTAPTEQERLEAWIVEGITTGLVQENPTVDANARDVLERIFGMQIIGLKGTELYEVQEGSREHRQIVSRKLEEWRSDKLGWMKALAKYFCEDKNKLLIVVYDNCDKRDRVVQIRMLEAAQWISGQVKCFVILPMRDVTFETYSNVPPLDAIQARFKYYLDPPSFPGVLKKRIELVLAEMDKEASRGSFAGPMGATVQFEAKDVRSYAEAIYTALFEHDRVISGLMFGLAGGDIRRAIELFADFCRSPYLPGVDLFNLRALTGQYKLEVDVVINALMRGKSAYFDGTQSIVKNILQLCHAAVPDHFARWAILHWMYLRHDLDGPTGSIGFHRWSDLQLDLIDAGHDSNTLSAECLFLMEAGLVESEHQEAVIKSDNDLLRISPSGLVHLELVTDRVYLGACAEDTKYKSREVAKTIAGRLKQKDASGMLLQDSILLNGWSLVKYLLEMEEHFYKPLRQTGAATLAAVREMLDKAIAEYGGRQVKKTLSESMWRDEEWSARAGSKHTGVVEGIAEAGVFVGLKNGPTGLVPKRYVDDDRSLAGLKLKDELEVHIESVDAEKGQARLKIVKILGSNGSTTIV